MTIGGGSCKFTSRYSGDVPSTINAIDIAFVGESVDDRGQASIDALQRNINATFPVRFDPNRQEIYLEGAATTRKGLATKIGAAEKILLDATTLGVGEILHILLALKSKSIKFIDFLYVEPKEYTRRDTNPEDPRMRDFSLTQNCRFTALQGFAHEYDSRGKASHVFFLGFEPARILNAIEQRGEPSPERYRYQMVMGVPAFNPGWEADSLRPHLDIFKALDVNERSIAYCQANSVREAYLTLWELYGKLGDSRECFFVSPLGTKPHAIGAALFLVETRGAENVTSLYYDHPERVRNRSQETGRWHHITVEMQEGAR